MLVPLSLSSSSAYDNDNDDKPSSHLYLRQQHTVQIIELVEGPPPPPRKIAYTPSSSAYSSYDDDDSDDDDDDHVLNDDQSQSDCTSYCSSDLHNAPLADEHPSGSLRCELSHEKFSTTNRILAWRENFSVHLSATASEPSLSSSLKRKINLDESDDNLSRSSKRSRSQASQGEASVLSLGMHSCPACDAFFMTRQSLRQHGRDAKANEACCIAVEYAFE